MWYEPGAGTRSGLQHHVIDIMKFSETLILRISSPWVLGRVLVQDAINLMNVTC